MHIQSAMFLIIAHPKTNYIFRTFRVKIWLRAQKQSFLSSKVGLQKWCPFFVFVCFNGCHFTKPGFAKKDTWPDQFFNSLHFCLSLTHNISKNWRPIFCLRFKIEFTRCDANEHILWYFACPSKYLKCQCAGVREGGP